MTAFAALADDNRTRIVELLAERDRTVTELVALFPISQPAVSRHLRLLREANLVTVEPDGRQRVYRLNPAAIAEVGGWAERVRQRWEARFDALGEHLDRVAREEERER